MINYMFYEKNPFPPKMTCIVNATVFANMYSLSNTLPPNKM